MSRILALSHRKILIENGHGIDTPGKRNPDGVLREYAWNRLIAGRVVSALTDLGHDATLLVPEPEDIYIEKELTWWQPFRMRLGGISILLIAFAILYLMFNLLNLFRP